MTPSPPFRLSTAPSRKRSSIFSRTHPGRRPRRPPDAAVFFGFFGGAGSRKLRRRVGVGPFAAPFLHARPDVLLGGDAPALLGFQRLAHDGRILGRSFFVV